MRRLIYVMGVALGGLVVLVLACASQGDVSLAQAARSVGAAALTGGFAGGESCAGVVTMLAAILGAISCLSGMVLVIALLFRIAVRCGRRWWTEPV